VDFALLNRPQLINATHREIAQVAHVALGAVGRVFADLEARGYIRGAPNKRRLLEPERLFDEWVTNYPIRLRPKLNPRRFHATDTDWWHNTHLNDRRAWWGGEVGADRLTNYLKPRTCTIYLDPVGRTNEQDDLIRVHRLRPDLNGEIEFLDAFWHFPPGPNDANTVPPMLVYADLVATLDPRNLEVAKLIREQHIQDALRKA
jgi:hypothetical protein